MTTETLAITAIVAIFGLCMLASYSLGRNHGRNDAAASASRVYPAPEPPDNAPPFTATVPQFRAPPLAPIDVDALLWAIAEKESGNRDDARGAAGERGRWQFMPATWAGLMPGVPHVEAHDYATARIAAHKLFDRILTTLNKRGMAVSVENVADCWLLGEWHNEAKQTSDYGRRVANLYDDRTASASKGGAL